MAAALAFVASLSFGVSNICSRRGTLWAPPDQGVRLTVLTAPPLFVLMALAMGELDELFSLSWEAYVFFGSAGVVHFSLGRSLSYRAIQAMGSARTVIVSNLSPLFSITIALTILDEGTSWWLALGAPLVILGPLIMAWGEMRRFNAPTAAGGPSIPFADLRRGAILAVGASVFWGISPVLVKSGLDEADVPTLGTLLSYSAAAVALAIPLARGGVRNEFLHMDSRGFNWYFLGGVWVSLAQFLRYLALSESSVTLVVLLMQTAPIFVLLFTFLVNRSIETFNRYVLAGSLLVVAGASVVAIGG